VSSDAVLIATNVTVRYRPYADRVPTARRSLGRLRHREHREVVALDRVSCEIRRGEAVAVIGNNGAGKSTLLRVLAGTLVPDAGTVEVRTTPPALLQLGVGFNPKLSGRDNVLLGGMALGKSRAAMLAQMGEITEFAEIGEAISRPVNTYSSGMRSRLSFAVAMTLQPETLLLDELLAVGDADFKAKSLAAMEGLLEHAGTVVMVTHSLSRAQQFCDTAIWLESGRVRMTGPAGEVVDAYRSEELGDEQEEPSPPPSGAAVAWSAKQRAQLVRRAIGGEELAALAAETGIDVTEIAAWRRRFIAGGRRALRTRFDSDDD
jgi:ABC-type polysaccharide/polyol phosphate transport system ATPase subunit